MTEKTRPHKRKQNQSIPNRNVRMKMSHKFEISTVCSTICHACHFKLFSVNSLTVTNWSNRSNRYNCPGVLHRMLYNITFICRRLRTRLCYLHFITFLRFLYRWIRNPDLQTTIARSLFHPLQCQCRHFHRYSMSMLRTNYKFSIKIPPAVDVLVAISHMQSISSSAMSLVWHVQADFSIFRDGGRRQLEFKKNQNFNGWWLQEADCVLP